MSEKLGEDITFKLAGNVLKIEGSIPAYKPVVFVGFNATLKSQTAKLIYAKLVDTGKISVPLTTTRYSEVLDALKTLDPNIEVTIEGPSTNELVGMIVQDSRVAMRRYLEIQEEVKYHYNNIKKSVEKMRETHPDLAEAVMSSLAYIRDAILDISVPLLNLYCKLKRQAAFTLELLPKYYSVLRKVVEDTVNMLREETRREEVFPENILPLRIEACEEAQKAVEGEYELEFGLSVEGTRLKKAVPHYSVSTSISSLMLFKLIVLALSLTKPVFMVIEEPEYALAPVQQVVLAQFIEKALEVAKKSGVQPIYVIITTHSPYIAAGFKEPVTFYFKYVKDVFTSEKAWPVRLFGLASMLLMAESGETR
jgi:hypothetical protein